jgi:DNA repair protein RadC
MDRPTTPETPSNEVKTRLSGPSPFEKDWRSPERALSDFLQTLSIDLPGVTARNLIDEFGSVSDLLAASWWQLRAVVGIRPASIIRASCHLMRAALAEPLERGPLVPRSKALIDFLHAEIGCLSHERLLALYVNSECRLLSTRTIAEGGPSGAPMNVRLILAHGLSAGASGLLLVHNHPSGDPSPSRDDLTATARLQRIAEEIDLALLDHLIIARGRVASIFEYWREAEWRHQNKDGCGS